MSNLNTSSSNKFALFALGFRPFFLGAALIAALSIIGWMFFYSGSNSDTRLHYYTAVTWHTHEMIFGYALAVIAGFLLTAVTNWTGRMTIQNGLLYSLFTLWLLARIVPFLTDNGWLIAGLDLLFYPYLIIAIAIPIIQSNNHRNLFVIVILLVLGFANLLMHMELLGITEHTLRLGQYLGLYTELLLIVIITGRVFPFFTGRGVKNTFTPQKYQWLEASCILSFAVFALVDMSAMSGNGISASLFVSLVMLTVVLHGLRIAFWYSHQIWSVPLVWVLHLGYYFLILGVMLKGMSAYNTQLVMPALHAMTVGGIGLITLGMMARVSLGHTGRNIHKPPKSIILMFCLLAIAALIRVTVAIIAGQHYLLAIQISALLWALAFFLFFIKYMPFLIRPRVDGKPG